MEVLDMYIQSKRLYRSRGIRVVIYLFIYFYFFFLNQYSHTVLPTVRELVAVNQVMPGAERGGGVLIV